MPSRPREMVSIMNPQQHFNKSDQDFPLYPQPPTQAFSTAPVSTMPADAFTFQRSMMGTSTPIAFDTWSDPQPPFLDQVSSPSIPNVVDETELQVAPSNHSTAASVPSASSSTAGSPLSHPEQFNPTGGEWPPAHGLSIVPNDYYAGTEYQFAPAIEEFQQPFDLAMKPGSTYDPTTMIHPGMPPYEPSFQPPPQTSIYPPPSPAMSSSPQPPQFGGRPGSQSPYAQNSAAIFPPQQQPQQQFSPFQATMDQRRPSVMSVFSTFSHEQPAHTTDESGRERQRCPHPDCGKGFKDLKAHMLTHQTERPEKCPIMTCEYHVKGFARKYDKNRHTLTHYKGTMVCGFCPGSGLAAEKSFNRSDVFKRHLTAVHGVEQAPPNSRKKTPASADNSKKLSGYAADATGKCSTCSVTFSNAQDFYEHLDDCVLRIVQQEDPAEAINARRLAEVENDKSVHTTLEKNNLPTTTPTGAPAIGEEDEDDVDMDEVDEEGSRNGTHKSPLRKSIKTGPANGIQKSKGLTYSRGGVSIPTKSKTRKNRRDYPSSWGLDKGQMTMKKRVMTVFDGGRRLAKDDMMLSTDHEVRVKLSDGKRWVTDLDVQTMKRTEGFHQATEKEKGPWVSDDPTHADIKMMLQLQQQQ